MRAVSVRPVYFGSGYECSKSSARPKRKEAYNTCISLFLSIRSREAFATERNAPTNERHNKPFSCYLCAAFSSFVSRFGSVSDLMYTHPSDVKRQQTQYTETVRCVSRTRFGRRTAGASKEVENVRIKRRVRRHTLLQMTWEFIARNDPAHDRMQPHTEYIFYQESFESKADSDVAAHKVNNTHFCVESEKKLAASEITAHRPPGRTIIKRAMHKC